MPSADDRLEPETMETYRTIETEGDGLRSYAAICSTLLLEQRSLCLVDEPEICLHPPQAHAMGRFIGAHVVRLTHVASNFRARMLTPDLLDEATSKPRSRSEAILEGLLSHAVVMCEAEGDRIVYDSVYRTFRGRRIDVRFVPSEGTGGFADPIWLYKALKVPTAVIADIDFLAKDGELRKVLTELDAPTEAVAGLCKRAREAVSRIRACVTQLDAAEIQMALRELAGISIDPTTNEDVKVRGKLQELANKMYRLHELKLRGLCAIPETHTMDGSMVPLRNDVQILLKDFASHGLFLVPVGELESWLPVLMKGQSREDKSKWAMLAAEKAEDVGERNEDIWQFIHSVYEFLEQRLRSSVN